MKNKLFVFGVAAFALAVIFGLLWVRGHSYTLKEVDYYEASREGVVKIFIPPEALNITGWIQPGRMQLVTSFRVCEDDFVAWAKTKEWDLKEVEGARVRNISRLGDPNDTVEISNGLLYRWVYDTKDPGSTFRVYAYDRTGETGYFTQLGD